jgi:hypothetical protein
VASVAILGLPHLDGCSRFGERHFSAPLALARMIHDLGLMYLILLAAIGRIALLKRCLSFLPLEFAIGMSAILAVFSVLGSTIY